MKRRRKAFPIPYSYVMHPPPEGVYKVKIIRRTILMHALILQHNDGYCCSSLTYSIYNEFNGQSENVWIPLNKSNKGRYFGNGVCYYWPAD